MRTLEGLHDRQNPVNEHQAIESGCISMKPLLMKPMAGEEPDVNDVAGTAETSAPRRIAEHDTDLFGIHTFDNVPLEHRVPE